MKGYPLLSLCCLLSLPLLAAPLHHAAAQLASQGHERMNASLALAIEADASTALELKLEPPAAKSQAVVQGQGQMSIVQQLAGRTSPAAALLDLGDVASVSRQKAVQVLSLKADYQYLVAMLITILTLIAIIVLLEYCLNVRPFDYEEDYAEAEDVKLHPFIRETTSSTISSRRPRESTRIPGTPNVADLPSAESFLWRPFGHSQAAGEPDMSLKLPTGLRVTDGKGSTYIIRGSVKPSKMGNRKIEIVQQSPSNIVAYLQVLEDDTSSGILFSLVDSPPIAYLDTQNACLGAAGQVVIFGGASDATAGPAAIVQPAGQSFVMTYGREKNLYITTDGSMGLQYVKDKSGRVIAKFTDDQRSGPAIHVTAAADAGLILIATVACLKLLNPPARGS